MSTQLLKIAFGELGQKEIIGDNHNPRILEYQEMTGLQFGDDDTPWCSIFANWVALQANLPRSHSATARSWLEVGESIQWPVPGDVVVFWRKRKLGPFGHVGFFLGYTKSLKSVYVLGGNQNDSVNIEPYKVSKILGFRTLEQAQELNVPSGYLRQGESNENVRKLQRILIQLDFFDGVADGVFGPLTDLALRDFQRSKGITIDGIYGSETRNALLAIL